MDVINVIVTVNIDDDERRLFLQNVFNPADIILFNVVNIILNISFINFLIRGNYTIVQCYNPFIK